MRSLDTTAIAQWAEALCGVSEDFDDAVFAAVGEVNRHTLTLEARKQRAATALVQLRQAARDALDRLDRIDAPLRVRRFHDAFVGEVCAVDEAFRVQAEAVDRATSEEDLEAINAAFIATCDEAGRATRAAHAELDHETRRLVRGIGHCGSVIW